jgi:hypothetical protein
MKLLLITQTPIIKQIFNLVSTKVALELTILDVNIVSGNFDIIIIEDALWDDKFPLKSYATRLGIITNENTKFIDKTDFCLTKPFLPSILLATLTKQVKILETIIIDTPEEEIEQSQEFIESLVENISEEILDETDESVIQSAFVSDGGILDSGELSKIQDILTNDNAIETKEDKDENDDWIELSDIIDKAIDEVKEYQFDIKEPIKLILNDYSINEISGLLNKLDQTLIDALVDGEEITLKLKVNK